MHSMSIVRSQTLSFFAQTFHHPFQAIVTYAVHISIRIHRACVCVHVIRAELTVKSERIHFFHSRYGAMC